MMRLRQPVRADVAANVDFTAHQHLLNAQAREHQHFGATADLLRQAFLQVEDNAAGSLAIFVVAHHGHGPALRYRKANRSFLGKNYSWVQQQQGEQNAHQVSGLRCLSVGQLNGKLAGCSPP
ncbi:hypothetical protein [Aquipseudomonas alcaligenes]|uniref:hypothetical protein n=1 Tax=Aquipseudomonas alcaligenes TaxID=43263 RepID=UPI00373FDA7E